MHGPKRMIDIIANISTTVLKMTNQQKFKHKIKTNHFEW
jgi:hypothetical protein